MQIREYLRGRPRLLVALVVIPLIAGIVTAVVLFRQPDEFTGAIQVQIPSTDNRSDSQIGLWIARLEQAAQTQDTVGSVAARTGVSEDDLLAAQVARIGKSDQVSVTMSSRSDQQQVLAATQQLTEAAIVRVTTSGENPQGELNAVQARLSGAQQDLVDFQNRNGLAIVSTTTSGEQAAIARLSPSLRLQYNVLNARVSSATQKLADIQGQLTTYQTQVDLARSGAQIVSATVVPEPRFRPIAEGAGVAFVITFLVVFGASMVPDLFRRQPRRGRGTAGGEGLSSGTPSETEASGASEWPEAAESSRTPSPRPRPTVGSTTAPTAAVPAAKASTGSDESSTTDVLSRSAMSSRSRPAGGRQAR